MNRAAWLAELTEWAAMWRSDDPAALAPARFDRLQANLFVHQFKHIPTYRRLVQGRGLAPPLAADVLLPLVPVTAFKSAALVADTVDPERALQFHTSGTSDGVPGRIHLADAALYDHSALTAFAHFLLPDAPPRLRCLSLVPSAEVRPHSSLGHMVAAVMARWGHGSGAWLLGADLDVAALARHLTCACADGVPVLILATSLAIAAWRDAWPPRHTLCLPPGSRLMDTGGAKGRSRQIDRRDQHDWLVATFGFHPDFLVGELGMTELATPRFETTLRAHVDPAMPALRAHAAPPWLRTLVLDPATQRPVARGEVGMLAHIDLANLETPAFLLTADLGRELPPAAGLQVIDLAGRIPGAAWRGCGLDVEELLASVTPPRAGVQPAPDA